MSRNQKNAVMEAALTWADGIAILTINNVARRNALSDPVKDQLLDHLTTLTSDRKCRAIVLTGAGGHFCAGGDVKNMQTRGTQNLMDRRLRMWTERLHRIVRIMVEGPKPVVTAVEGTAFGAGLSLVLASEFTVMARSARLAAAQILRGLCPDGGLYYLMSARAGPGRARELLLSGRQFGAEEALNYGVAHELVDDGKTLDAAMRVAERFAAVPPLAFALGKAAMTNSYRTLDACFRAETNFHPIAGVSQDHRESIAAFLERRNPIYIGE